ncbi:hypothetical protein SY88_09045 [Clostridiales bacterium PH28_bin88]|nr:hypothetical protein SY88_09045 [Clostridiales bacterium PH28_bin88]
MGELTERMEIRLDYERMQLLKKESRERGVSMAEIVREAIDARYRATRDDKLRAAEELFQVEAPVDDWEEMKRQIEEARRG